MLKHRLISGISLIAVLALIVFWPSEWASALFLAFGVALVVLALQEFFRIAKGLGAPGFPVVTTVAGVLMVLLPAARACIPALRELPELLLPNLVMAVFLVAAFAALFRTQDLTQGVKSFFASVAGFFYIAFTLHFLARIYFWESDLAAPGRYFFLYVVIVTKFGDIGGYTLGKLTSLRAGGNHKMIPRISPGKSWEGLVGSVLFSVGIALALSHFLGSQLQLESAGAATLPGMAAVAPLAGWRSVLVGVFLALLGLISDLTESVLKRAGGVKDSGGVLPGMGGILDAIDSLLLVSPLFFCYLLYVTSI